MSVLKCTIVIVLIVFAYYLTLMKTNSFEKSAIKGLLIFVLTILVIFTFSALASDHFAIAVITFAMCTMITLLGISLK